MSTNPQSFSVVMSADPQYPWGPGGPEEAERRLRDQYESMNHLARDRGNPNNPCEVEGVLILGDLTAFSHDWQYNKFQEIVGTLVPKVYPGLGNHDYQNNVDDSFNNDAASRAVDFMYRWLKAKHGAIQDYDFMEEGPYYKFPEARIDYTGSLSYSFNVGKLHFVQLQNRPSYTREWNTWNWGGARRDFYYITDSVYWLEHDLAIARNNGDVIILVLHNYDGLLDEIITRYGVSAVVAGHTHSCGLERHVGSNIPLFRAGSADTQDYLVADINLDAKQMTVWRMLCPPGKSYAPTGEQWSVALNDTRPAPALPVPAKRGFVSFLNEGGFNAQFEVRYVNADGSLAKENTGTMNLHNRKTFKIPRDATDFRVLGWMDTGSGLKPILDVKFPTPPDRCFKAVGLAWDPKVNEDCN